MDARKLYQCFDPGQPATEESYCNLAAVRGGDAYVRRVQRTLELSAEQPIRGLFSGHIGCGKSSELRKLATELESAGSFFPILVDTTSFLDDNDVSSVDLLLGLVAEVAAQLKPRLPVPLEDSYFSAKLRELSEFLGSEVKPDELQLPWFKARLQQARSTNSLRERIRENFRSEAATLYEQANSFIEKARQALRKLGFNNLVVILDNLEKVRRYRGDRQGSGHVEDLFIADAPMLNALRCHAIFTVPLSLVRSRGPELSNLYSVEPFVLPMVKIETRSRQPFADGREALRRLVEKRVSKLAPLEEWCEVEALDILIGYSGGDVRLLMRLLRECLNLTEKFPLTTLTARRALKPVITAFSTSVPESFWPKLVKLHCSKDAAISTDDADYVKMLEQSHILEYLNGEQSDDPLLAAIPWYAVHPLVRELPKFKGHLETAAGGG